MSHAGEITRVGALAQPELRRRNHGGAGPPGVFESIAGIARAKYELIESLASGGIAVLNADDAYVSQFGRDFHGTVVTFGRAQACRRIARRTSNRAARRALSSISVAEDHVSGRSSPLLGEHNIYNALAADCGRAAVRRFVARGRGVARTLSAGDKRGEILKIGGATVINDCYNSNPKALESMVRSLAQIPASGALLWPVRCWSWAGGRRDAPRQRAAHGTLRNRVVIGVRGLAKAMVEGAREGGVHCRVCRTPEEAGEWLKRELKPGT